MRMVVDEIRRCAATSDAVLIQGETGTGKELVAQSIHRHSMRQAGPFVAVNCSIGPTSLLESELFGYERGAFTGASVRRVGRIEEAHRGTLFLDEIAELPIEGQAKLLRVIAQREVPRLGARTPIHVDFRLIVATNSDLQAAVARGAFRADLYYRVDVLSIRLPPVRERGNDIALLVAVLFEKLRAERASPSRLSIEAHEQLSSYSWPGNVREMQHTLLKSLVAAGGELVTVRHLPATVTGHLRAIHTGVRPLPPGLTLPAGIGRVVEEHKRQWILDALAASNGEVLGAAERLGINRRTLHTMISKYELRPGSALPDDA